MAEKINETLNPIKFNSRVSVPTATGTDPSEVVNIEYFHDNASKVDWENIDSEVHVINDHNVEIDGGLIVHGKTDDNILEVSENKVETDITEQLQYIVLEKEPIYVDGAWTWDTTALENYTDPYWGTFPVTAGNTYIIKPQPDNYQYPVLSVVLKTNTEDLVGIDWTPSPVNGATFTATCDGLAYISSGTVVFQSEYSVSVLTSSGSSVKINGDLEVLGDLSFGADSHLVFGTIEGTDFIADYAKVKNAPVEDDDVVNLKTLKEWVPSGTNSKKYLLVAMNTGGAAGSYTLNNLPYSTLMNHYDSSRDIAQGTVVLKTGTTYYLELDIITGDEGAVTAELTTPTGDPGTTMILTFTAHDGGSYSFPTFLTGQFTEDGSTFTAAINCQNVPVFGNISIYSLESATGSSDISDYQGNAKINGNLEVTGNLSFDGDLEMSSIEAQSIKINGKRVLTEDDLANLVAYPAAEDYSF